MRMPFSMAVIMVGIPGLHGDHGGLGDVKLGDLIERRRRAEVIDANAVEQADGGAARAELRDFVLEICQHFVHFSAGVGFYFFYVFESGAARSGGLILVSYLVFSRFSESWCQWIRPSPYALYCLRL